MMFKHSESGIKFNREGLAEWLSETVDNKKLSDWGVHTKVLPNPINAEGDEYPWIVSIGGHWIKAPNYQDACWATSTFWKLMAVKKKEQRGVGL